MLNRIDKETYEVIKKSVEFSEEEFMNMTDSERKEWVDACRLARILDSECHDLMVKGYSSSGMYSDNGTFNLSIATCIVRSKKRMLNVIEKYTDIDITPAQFILMGEEGTFKFQNDAMKQINLETARDLAGNKHDSLGNVVVTRMKNDTGELKAMFSDAKDVVDVNYYSSRNI